ncbi:MAG: ABC transporter permease [Firmicutes bacterium]|nr:ABC transporter permease [Bacillota bacterium]
MATKLPTPVAKALRVIFSGLSRLWNETKISIFAVLFGLLVGAIIVLTIGRSPVDVFRAVYSSSFGSLQGFFETMAYVAPLILTGLAIAFAFRCGLFNIGAEGQVIVGMFVSGFIGFTWPDLPTIILLPSAILGGAVAGAIWAGIPGLLKAKLGVHEVVNTIMMNHIAFYLVNWLVSGPYKASGVQGTDAVPANIRLTRLSDIFGTSAADGHTGIFIALAAAFICWFLLWRTTTGFEVRATGLNPHAAEYAGISVAKNILLAMLISGLFAGLAGGIQTLGVRGRVLQMSAFPNLGFNGIAVALIGKNHPLGVIFGALLFGVLLRADAAIQIQADVPRQVVAIIQASVIFFVAAEQIFHWLFIRRKKEVVVND